MSLTTLPEIRTITTPLSLTTPFTPPDACWEFERRTRTEFISGETLLDPYLISDPALSGFTSCQPPGWASVAPESRFSFSPAVCPSAWTAWNIATTEVSSETVTTAWCCDARYTLYSSDEYPLESFTKPCIKSEVMGMISLHLHLPWHISWQQSDLTLLTPGPPSLSAEETISSWGSSQTLSETPKPLPTTGISTTSYTPVSSVDDSGTLDGLLQLTLGLSLGLGLGGSIVLIALCMCCCRGSSIENTRRA
ncbi:hypothetical protein BJY04DRAFT_43266 [Aspergillus karnatakaensis]|uniref:uncharacterized protein n=1 Tax=Aspergillus karnatakaensis TaxID=1810916 RepID=UPI003CCD535D